MNKLTKYAFADLYAMASGISTTKEQAGHGSPFVSFSTVFNNYFLPDTLPDLMDTSLKEQETYSIKEGDILVTRTSETIDELAMSCVAVKDYPSATYSGFTKRLRPLTTGIAYDKYLAFYLRGYLFRKAVTNNAFMTLRASFNEDIFSFLSLYLPDYQEQVKIGDMLYNMEQKIQLNKQICAELEAMAKTLYDYWFVQFDFPDGNGRPYRTSGGEMVWNEQLKREIPKGWRCVALSDFISVENSSVNPATLGTEIMEHYSIPAYDDNFYPAFEQADTIQSGKYRVRKNSILVSKLNPQFKRVWDPFCISENTICSTEFMVYIPHNDYLRPFCFALVNSDGFYRHMVSKAISSTGSRKRIQPDVSLMYQFAVPNTDSLLSTFSERYRPIMDKLKQVRLENQELTKLRDWLLPMLMNGQARVN
jgi:type I restriction enzyme S subunit